MTLAACIWRSRSSMKATSSRSSRSSESISSSSATGLSQAYSVYR